MTSMHTHAHSDIISPEGLPLALDRGNQGEKCGEQFLHWAERP